MALQVVRGDNDLKRLFESTPEWLSMNDLKNRGWDDKEQLHKCLNDFLKNSIIEVRQQENGVTFRRADPYLAQKLQGLDGHHRQVLQLVEQTGNQGAWSKTLKDQSGIAKGTFDKITKELIRRKMIKEVKSAEGQRKKMLMLYDLEPAAQVSGGPWYRDGEFKFGWVEWMRNCCKAYVEQHSEGVSLHEILDFISQQPEATSGLSRPLSESDMTSIMQTLQLDEEVNLTTHDGIPYYSCKQRSGAMVDIFSGRMPSFMGRDSKAPSVGLNVPCLKCPLKEECQVGGRICPEKCTYLTVWLNRTGSNSDACEHGGDMDIDADMSW